MTIKFIGATETVTGSKHLLITEKGKQILLDCGLYQGTGKDTDEMNRHLGFDPSQIDAVILSHAHIDHSGNIPYLIKSGFQGKIYCTPGTMEVCEILLRDSGSIHESDIRFINKKRKLRGEEPLKPLYTEGDAKRSMKHFKTVPYNSDFQLNDEISFRFTDAGHILGSASIHITATESNGKKSLTFTGDIGRYHDLLMNDPQPFPPSEYIICESTYGDRLHESDEDAELRFLNIIRHTCLEKKGKLIIPAFSLGRTQEIVFILDKMKNKNLLPEIPVYVDSPLSTNATEIMRKHIDCLNEKVRDYVKTDPDPFGFSTLKYITEANESMKLNESKVPCIIISASGMLDAGRIKHHLKHAIQYDRNTILIVGYCSPNTLGGKIIAGAKEVRIFGDFFPVNAKVEIMNSFSAHGDYSEMIRFLSCQDKSKVKEIFLVHGEPNTKVSFKEKLMAEGYKRITIPNKNETFII